MTSRPSESLTLLPKAVVRAQKIHAYSMLVFPSLAAVYAAVSIWQGTFEVWQIWFAILGYVMTMLAITVGFHRLLTHRAMEASRPLTWLLVFLGCAAFQGPPIYWAANHRRHHRFGDVDGDPHSPKTQQGGNDFIRGLKGFFHAHIGWTFSHPYANASYYCRDLLRDPLISRMNNQYFFYGFAGLVIPTVLGGLMTMSIDGVLQGLIWGGGVRLFLSYHLTHSINSITHMFGYRSFATKDDSRNTWWLGLLTLGEAWHNNHHARPSSARFGRQMLEIDVGWLFIRLMAAIGQMKNVKE